jgi:predicted nucleic acid-binding protein
MELATAALADTSWFIAREQRGPIRPHPGELVVSIVTIGELRFGVLATADPESRALRLSTLLYAESLGLLPIDRMVAEAWAQLMRRLRETGVQLTFNDSWIAATAIAHRLPLVSRDADYDDVPGLQVIRV